MNAAAEAYPIRAARGRETKARLYAAAEALFAEHGYATTTVAQIVVRAGVSKGTFFVHFSSKAAVVTGLVEAQVASARRARQRASARGSLDALSAAVTELGRHAARSRGLSRTVIAAGLEDAELGATTSRLLDELADTLEDDVRAAQAAGDLRGDVAPREIVDALMNLYYGAVLHWCLAGQRGRMDLSAQVTCAIATFRAPSRDARPLRGIGHAKRASASSRK